LVLSSLSHSHVNLEWCDEKLSNLLQILHYKNKANNGVMKAGHVFTIEPMINEGEVPL